MSRDTDDVTDNVKGVIFYSRFLILVVVVPRAMDFFVSYVI